MTFSSSLRSVFAPTRRKGVPLLWWFISGYHLDLMFAKKNGIPSAMTVQYSVDIMYRVTHLVGQNLHLTKL